MSEFDADERNETFALFVGARRVASGDLAAIRSAMSATNLAGPQTILSTTTGRVIDLAPSNTLAPSTEDEAAPPRKAGRGRPKLGVIPREVTLLQRHWDWLSTQPGGASAALRRLVDQARRDNQDEDLRRSAQEAAHRAMTTLAGDLEGYEDALRALYANRRSDFENLTAKWPPDIGDFARNLAAASWTAAPLD